MGLLKTAAKVAVASSVHGRVQRRQQRRWAAADQAAAVPAGQPSDPAAHPPAPIAPPPSTDQLLAQLKTFGELRDTGVLTDYEFEIQKVRLLAGAGG
ncbi:SHOCT domain-containing protein [Microlunatus elymi]|uniref:SHOCT domain-containing protein n=1 Tax=Microlunatus elymi TaxID=2596828 RepID=A0A516PZV0_9ACTN|nr:SHOCT domain-containing protein [Microlunatus elymi]QDP96704.1 SHOCT domain-containing protein [Microlunatus elymi]